MRFGVSKLLCSNSRHAANTNGSEVLRFVHAQNSSSEMPTSDFKPAPYKGPSVTDVMRIRADHLSPSVQAYYRRPLLLHQGHMQYLYDQNGRRYLDLFGGIVTVSVGHCHPKVTEAAKRQLDEIWHTTAIYLHPRMHEYAEKLLKTLPSHLQVVHLCNSGTEANDLALMLARLHTGNYDVISLRNAYHGMNSQIMALTAQSTWKYNVPHMFGVYHAMNADPYRGLWGGAACRDSPVQPLRSCSCPAGSCMAADMYAEQLHETLQYSCSKGGVAAMFIESIQGVGGTVQFPKGYVKKAEQLIRSNGGLLIMDEVQTGFGRTGEHFWGFQGHDATPDIVTMAKGIGNGFPLAAVATTKEVSAKMSQALHFNTYGGNPLASAVGIAVLDAIEEDGCQEISARLGTLFLEKLSGLQRKYPVMGDVRGKGLMIGVELVENRTTKSPLTSSLVIDLWEAIKDHGVLVGKGGYFGNVLRIKPPMCLTEADVNFAVEIMDQVLEEFHQKNHHIIR